MDTGSGLEIKKLERVTPNIRLTARDLQVLEFALEMKFASLKQIHRKFFSVKPDGSVSDSTWWARERIQALARSGFLKSQRISFFGESFYLTTELGVMALTTLRPNQNFVSASPQIDIRTFEHDRLVCELRLAMEASGGARDWASERKLKSESSLQFGLARKYQPDAIYRNRKGNLNAFEFELTTKSKDRYLEKFRKYKQALNIIRESPEDIFLNGVLFVAGNNSSFEILSQLVAQDSARFSVYRISDLVSSEVFGVKR